MRAPSLAWSSLLNFADGAVTLAGALVVSIILAHKLGPDGFGVYALTMSVVMFTLLFARLGISATVRRYVAELAGKSDLRLAAIILGRALRLGLFSGFLATAAARLVRVVTAEHRRFLANPEYTKIVRIDPYAPSRVARVWMFARSLPAFGSENP